MKKSDMKHQIGDDIYVESSYYMSHGSDDFTGGLCRITRIRMMVGGRPFVCIAERPGYFYDYEHLMEEQETLKKNYGKQRGRLSPDVDLPWIEPGDTVGFN